jgi:hypothetical protein
MKEKSLKQFVSDTIVNFSIENGSDVNFAKDENGVITGAIKEGVKSIPTGGHTVAKGLRYPTVGFIRGATNSTLAGLAGGALLGAGVGHLAGDAATGAKIGAAVGGAGGLIAAPAVGVAKGSWDTLDRVGNTSNPSIIKQLGPTASAGLGAAGGAILGGIIGHQVGEGNTVTGAKIGAGLGAGAGLLAGINATSSGDTRPFINPDNYYVLEVRNKNDIRLIGNKMGYGRKEDAIIRGEDYDAMSNYNVSVLKGSTVLDYYPDVFRSEYSARNFSDIEKTVSAIYVTKKREQLSPNDQVICIGKLKQKNSHRPTRSEAQNRNWLANKYTFSVLKDKDYYYSANSESEAEQIAKDVLKDHDGIIVKLLPAGDLDNKQTMDPIGRALLGL